MYTSVACFLIGSADGSTKGSVVLAPGGALSIGGSLGLGDGDAISIVSDAQKLDAALGNSKNSY